MFSRARTFLGLALSQAAWLFTRSRRLFGLIVFSAISVSILAPAARADTITEYVGGNSIVGNGFFGQSVTTPGGGPWSNIAFNFYDQFGNPYAFGDLYLLNQAYTGTPSTLSSSSTGYIAQAAASGGTSWVFDPSVTLQSGTQYFFYMGGNTPTVVNLLYGTGGYPGGDVHSSGLANTSYASTPNIDMNFTLEAVPGPIPGAGFLSYLLVGFGGLAAFRKKLRTRAAALFAALPAASKRARARA